MRPALILLAFLIPNITGKEFNPSFESPSTLLKSFITAMPSPERLYARVSNAVTIVTALLTLAYSLSGLGIAIINDFKSVEGDSKLGLNSLPVIFGIKNASRISAGLIDIFQLAMVLVLIVIGQHLASVILVLLVIPQITFQDMWLLRDPLKFDVKYQASAQPFLITGMLVTALAIGHSFLVT